MHRHDVGPDATSTRSTNATSAGMVTTAITVLNIVLGFGFQSLIAYALGLGTLADRFQLTWAIVTFGTTVSYTLVTTVLVPRVHAVESEVQLGDTKYLALFGAAATIVQFAAGVSVSPQLGHLLMFSAPSHVLAALTAPVVALAYLEHRFGLAALGNVFNGVGLLVAATAAVLVGPTPVNLGIALTAGYIMQLLLTALPLRSSIRAASRSVAIGLKPITALILFTMLTKFQPVLERTLAESLGIGSTAALGFGQKITQGLLLLGAFGLAITATGSLSKAYSSNNPPLAAKIFARTLVSTFMACTLVLAFFLPFSRIAVQALFQRGEFSSTDTSAVFEILLAQLPWVFAGAMTGVVTSYMYVARRYAKVALSSAIGLFATLSASAALMTVLPDLAVAVGSSVGAISTLAFALFATLKEPIWTNVLEETRKFTPAVIAAGLTLTVSAISFFIASTVNSGPFLGLAVFGPVTMLVLSLAMPPARNACKELIRARI